MTSKHLPQTSYGPFLNGSVFYCICVYFEGSDSHKSFIIIDRGHGRHYSELYVVENEAVWNILTVFTVRALLEGPKSKTHKTVLWNFLSTKSFWKDFSSAKRQMVLKR